MSTPQVRSYVDYQSKNKHRIASLLIEALNIAKGIGSIVVVNPDGSGMRTIIPPEAGFMPNDLVFDAQGVLLHRLPWHFEMPGEDHWAV